jgi:uncharacterized protein YbbC (DUF1343 family)
LEKPLMKTPDCPGIDALMEAHTGWIAGRRVGAVVHPASLDGAGAQTADRLAGHPDIELAALFGPEHGAEGMGDAGEKIDGSRHPLWDIPIHSLYGDQRKPAPEMLEGLDTVIFDLQDLGVRCYTYVSSLHHVMEACAENDKSLVVCDRPVPDYGQADGPVLESTFNSFVGCIPAPLVYGMTPGETALWLNHRLGLDLDLQVARMSTLPSAAPAPWCPPSPGIRSWDTALLYPVTVFCEALPALDCWRAGLLPFQVLGALWIDADETCRALADTPLQGLEFHPFWYSKVGKPYAGKRINAVRMVVKDRASFKPVETAVWLLWVLQGLYGMDTLWAYAGTRESFFDQLIGTDRVRKALQAQDHPETIMAEWQEGITAFKKDREPFLLYRD